MNTYCVMEVITFARKENKMKVKGKVKSFVKKHEKAISKTTLILSGLGIGFVVGKKVTTNKIYKELPEFWTGSKRVDEFIGETQKAYPNIFCIATINSDNMKLEDLGKLGEVFISQGEKPDLTFTEFLMIGPEKK